MKKQQKKGEQRNHLTVPMTTPVVITDHALTRYMQRAGKPLTKVEAAKKLEHNLRHSALMSLAGTTSHGKPQEVRSFIGERFICVRERGSLVVITVTLNETYQKDRFFDGRTMDYQRMGYRPA